MTAPSGRAFKVGLTGGIASGKSTVARLLAEEGFTVVDADRLVAALYRPGEPGVEAVRELFGDEVVTAQGGVDHARLAQRVFADADARRRLEAAIHPLVRRRFGELAAQIPPGAAPGVVVLEATLLVEAGYGPDFDLVVTVEAAPETRLRRAVARGLDEAAARARLAAQGDGTMRRRAAHWVIENDGSLGELRRRVVELAAEIRTRAA